jgi:hypothetical protein
MILRDRIPDPNSARQSKHEIIETTFGHLNEPARVETVYVCFVEVPGYPEHTVGICSALMPFGYLYVSHMRFWKKEVVCFDRDTPFVLLFLSCATVARQVVTSACYRVHQP